MDDLVGKDAKTHTYTNVFVAFGDRKLNQLDFIGYCLYIREILSAGKFK